MAVAIPLIAGSTTETATGENEGYAFRAEKVDTSTGTTTISINKTTANHVLVNGIDIGLYSAHPVLIGDGIVMSFTMFGSTCQFIIGNTQKAKSNISGDVKAEITLTITDGKIVGKETTYEGVDWFILPSETGDLGAMTSAKVSKSTTCYWAKATLDTSGVDFIGAYGAVGDVASMDQIQVNYGRSPTSSYTPTHASTTASSIAISEEDGILTVGALMMAEAIANVSELPLAFAPIEYSYNVPGTGTVATLVNLIPLLMMVGLILAVVSAYLTKKMEE